MGTEKLNLGLYFTSYTYVLRDTAHVQYDFTYQYGDPLYIFVVGKGIWHPQSPQLVLKNRINNPNVHGRGQGYYFLSNGVSTATKLQSNDKTFLYFTTIRALSEK